MALAVPQSASSALSGARVACGARARGPRRAACTTTAGLFDNFGKSSDAKRDAEFRKQQARKIRGRLGARRHAAGPARDPQAACSAPPGSPRSLLPRRPSSLRFEAR